MMVVGMVIDWICIHFKMSEKVNINVKMLSIIVTAFVLYCWTVTMTMKCIEATRCRHPTLYFKLMVMKRNICS